MKRQRHNAAVYTECATDVEKYPNTQLAKLTNRPLARDVIQRGEAPDESYGKL